MGGGTLASKGVERCTRPLGTLNFLRLYPDAAIGRLYTSLFHAVLDATEDSVEVREGSFQMRSARLLSPLVEREYLKVRVIT